MRKSPASCTGWLGVLFVLFEKMQRKNQSCLRITKQMLPFPILTVVLQDITVHSTSWDRPRPRPLSSFYPNGISFSRIVRYHGSIIIGNRHFLLAHLIYPLDSVDCGVSITTATTTSFFSPPPPTLC